MEHTTAGSASKRGYWATVYAVCFQPSAFFTEASETRSRWSPVLFFLVTELIAAPVGALFYGLFLKHGAAQIAAGVGASLAMVPLLTLPAAVLNTVLSHAVLRLFGSRKARLADTFAAVCFAAAPALLALTVPFLGIYIAGIWGIVVVAKALGRTHGMSATTAFLSPVIASVLLALMLRMFVVEAFKIPAGSMIPALEVGDHIFVNKFIYGLRVPGTNVKLGMEIRKPKRGEVIVFKFPKDQDKDFIKRVVAVEGDTVEIRDNVVWVNGQALARKPLEGACVYQDFEEMTGRWEERRCTAFVEESDARTYAVIYDRGGVPRSWPAVTIKPGNVFVLGDNRDNSHDSRFWGTVPFELIKGRAGIVWFSNGPAGIRGERIGRTL